MMHLSVHLEYQLCIDIQITEFFRPKKLLDPVKDPEAQRRKVSGSRGVHLDRQEGLMNHHELLPSAQVAD